MPSEQVNEYPDPRLFSGDWEEWAARLIQEMKLRDAARNPAVFGTDILDGTVADQKVSASSRDNLIQNPGFESVDSIPGRQPERPWFLPDDTVPWAVGTTPRSGGKSLDLAYNDAGATEEVFANGDPTIGIAHPVTVLGDRYYLEFYARSSSASTAAQVFAIIEFYDEDGVQVGATVAGTGVTPTATYQKVGVVAEVSDANTAYVVFGLRLVKGADTGLTLHADDFYARRQISSDLYEPNSVTETALGDDSVGTVKIQDNATSAFVQGKIESDANIFSGGSDDNTWIRVFPDGALHAQGGIQAPGLVQDKPVQVGAICLAAVEQIRANSVMQTPLAAGPLLFMRVVRWLTSDNPAESAITSDPVGTDVDLVYEPDSPVSLSITGYMPAVQSSIGDLPPADGDYNYDVQVKWEKQVYSEGLISVSAGGAVTVDTGAPLWRSWVDPADVLGLAAAASLDLDFVIDPDGSGAGPETLQIQDVPTQVTITLPTPSGAYGPNEDYRIEDPNVAPDVDFTWRHLQVWQVKK